MKQVPLRSRKYPGVFALVDDEDYERVMEYSWHVSVRSFYARTIINGKSIRLSRFIESATDPSMEVDHVNHDTLDDRRHNHRLVTHSQNMMNQPASEGGTSRYKGVCYYIKRDKWRVQIKFNGKSLHIGYFDSEIEAAQAYDSKAKELGWPKSGLNFPDV